MTGDTLRQLAAAWGFALVRAGRWYIAYTRPCLIACVAPDPGTRELRPDALRVLEPSVEPLGTVTATALACAVGTVDALSVAGRCRLPLVQCELAIGAHYYDRWLLAPLVPHLTGMVTVYVQPAGELTLASGEVRVAVMRISEHAWSSGKVPRLEVMA